MAKKEVAPSLEQRIASFRERQAQLQKEQNAVRSDVLALVRQLVKEFDLAPNEVWDIPLKTDERVRPVRYFQNPNNPAERCSAYGRKPKWFKEALKKGITKEQMQVNE